MYHGNTKDGILTQIPLRAAITFAPEEFIAGRGDVDDQCQIHLVAFVSGTRTLPLTPSPQRQLLVPTNNEVNLKLFLAQNPP
jgi:hypothetical protein